MNESRIARRTIGRSKSGRAFVVADIIYPSIDCASPSQSSAKSYRGLPATLTARAYIAAFAIVRQIGPVQRQSGDHGQLARDQEHRGDQHARRTAAYASAMFAGARGRVSFCPLMNPPSRGRDDEPIASDHITMPIGRIVNGVFAFRPANALPLLVPRPKSKHFRAPVRGELLVLIGGIAKHRFRRRSPVSGSMTFFIDSGCVFFFHRRRNG